MTLVENKFLKRLRKELPIWVERGWVNPECQGSIINYVASHTGSSTRYLPLIFSLLGVLLLGAGIITYFAANWQGMTRLTKLGILFGSLWSAYALSGYFLDHKHSQSMAQGMLLLGVILFGAHIMLISQIYHIDAHFPNGVLIWSLGGLLVAYPMHSLPALMAGIGLAILWTCMETMGFNRSFHWPFLIVWLLFLPLICRRRWKPAFHFAMIGLLIFSLFTFLNIVFNMNDWSRGAGVYLAQIYFLSYFSLFMAAALLLARKGKDRDPLAEIVQRYAALAALAGFFALTFPGLFEKGNQWQTYEYSLLWILITLICLVMSIGLFLWYRYRICSEKFPAYITWGEGLFVLIITLMSANLFLPGGYDSLVAILFNLLFFSGLIWLIYAGFHAHNRFLVNLSFLFFALTFLSRYLDTFWTLLHRSFFFMVGGLLLIGGGYLMERQRRKVIGSFSASRENGGKGRGGER